MGTAAAADPSPRTAIAIAIPTIATPIVTMNAASGSAARNPIVRRRQSRMPDASIAGNTSPRSRTCTGLTSSPASRALGGGPPATSAGTISDSHSAAKAIAATIISPASACSPFAPAKRRSHSPRPRSAAAPAIA